MIEFAKLHALGNEKKTSFSFAFLSFFRNFAIEIAKLLVLGIKNKWTYFVLRSFFRNLAIKDGEVTPSRQKKETSFFVLRSTFRNFAPK